MISELSPETALLIMVGVVASDVDVMSGVFIVLVAGIDLNAVAAVVVKLVVKNPDVVGVVHNADAMSILVEIGQPVAIVANEAVVDDDVLCRA